MAQPIRNAMTVDVEDYFHVSAFEKVLPRSAWPTMESRVVANTERVLDLFAEAGAQATFFTLGIVATGHPALVRRIVADGHELASHGWSHVRATDQTPSAFFEDVARTRKTLEDVAGVAVRGYRATSFSIGAGNLWAYEELVRAGYEYSSSINPIAHDHYGMPDAPRFAYREPRTGLLEIPVTTFERGGKRRPGGGGGFFRLFPYGWFRRGITGVNDRDRQPAIFYFHPWEIDPGQPRIAGAPLKARFRHYVNLGRMEGKLRRLLADFPWTRVDKAIAQAAAQPAADAAE